MAKHSGLYYEILSREIFDSIVNQDQVENIDVQHNVILQGKLTRHQIDVYWEFKRGKITYRNVVQVKDWGGAVSQGEIWKFRAVLDDLPDHPRGIFVSRHGYQKGALDLAKKLGILAYKLEIIFKTGDASIATGIMTFTIPIHTASNYGFIIDHEWMTAECKRLSLPSPKPTQLTFYPHKLNFFDESGNIIANLQEIVNKRYPKKPQNLNEKPCKHNFKKPTFIDSGFDKLPRYKVLRVEFTISVTKHVKHTPIVGTPIIEFILENVLDGSLQKFDKKFKAVT